MDWEALVVGCEALVTGHTPMILDSVGLADWHYLLDVKDWGLFFG